MRGVFLLVAVAELLAVVPLVVLSMVSAWVLAPSLLATGWALAWLRSGVRVEQAAARARRRRAAEREPERAPTAARSATGAVARGTSAPTSPATATSPPAAAAPPPAATTPPAHGPAAGAVDGEEAAGSGVIDVDVPQESTGAVTGVVAEAAPAVAVPLVDEDDIPLTWDPVPVPRPTYTMKAKAERPDPVPADVTPAGQPAERGDAAAYDDRRVAGA